MMSKHSLFLLPIFITSLLAAQPIIEWQRTFGGSYVDQGQSIQSTRDGGYIVASRTISNNGDVFGNHGGVDFWVLKLNESGILQWKKTYGGSDNETPFAVQQTVDGGFIIAGHTLSNNGDVSGNHGYYDAWVLKIDSVGVLQWQKSLGGSGWEVANSIQQTTDGGFIFAGQSTSNDGDVSINRGSFDYWVVKLNSVGEIEWEKSHGGSNEDIGYSVKQTVDGGYIVAGESSSNDGEVTGNHGSSDYWVIKLNYEGKKEWEKSLGGNSIDRANVIEQSNDGGYIVFGQTYSSNGDVTGQHGFNDFWAVKLNEMGELEWQKSLGGSNEDFARSIFQTKDNGYVLSGQTQSNDGDVNGNDGGADIWLVKLKETGEIQWQKTIGGTQADLGNSVLQTKDEGYIVLGYTGSNNGDVSGNHGSDDVWVVKLSPLPSPTTTPSSSPLEIFPNPASQSISIKIPASPSSVETTAGKEPFITINISDLLGRIVSHQTISNTDPGSEKINIAALADGFYFLTATAPSGKVFVGKFRKE